MPKRCVCRCWLFSFREQHCRYCCGRRLRERCGRRGRLQLGRRGRRCRCGRPVQCDRQQVEHRCRRHPQRAHRCGHPGQHRRGRHHVRRNLRARHGLPRRNRVRPHNHQSTDCAGHAPAHHRKRHVHPVPAAYHAWDVHRVADAHYAPTDCRKPCACRVPRGCRCSAAHHATGCRATGSFALPGPEKKNARSGRSNKRPEKSERRNSDYCCCVSGRSCTLIFPAKRRCAFVCTSDHSTPCIKGRETRCLFPQAKATNPVLHAKNSHVRSDLQHRSAQFELLNRSALICIAEVYRAGVSDARPTRRTKTRRSGPSP